VSAGLGEMKKSASQQHVSTAIARQGADPYAAGGRLFRTEQAGKGISRHASINSDGLTPKMKRDYEQHRQASLAAAKGKETRKKNAWVSDPIVQTPKSPKMGDQSPFLNGTYKKFLAKKRQKADERMNGTFSTAPFSLPNPISGFEGLPSISPNRRRIVSAEQPDCVFHPNNDVGSDEIGSSTSQSSPPRSSPPKRRASMESSDFGSVTEDNSEHEGEMKADVGDTAFFG
jgi:hypothetical protein